MPPVALRKKPPYGGAGGHQGQISVPKSIKKTIKKTPTPTIPASRRRPRAGWGFNRGLLIRPKRKK